MAVYRVISTDLRTGDRIAELPLTGLKFGRRLNDVGMLSGVVHLGSVWKDPPAVAVRILTESGDFLTTESGQRLTTEADPVVVSTEGATARIRAATLVDAVAPARRHLFIERDGVIVGDGIVWQAHYDDTNQTIDVRAASTWSYFRHRYLRSRLKYTSTDQLTIARALVTAAQNTPGGDIGVTYDATVSGVDRDRTYERFEYKQIAEAVEQLAAVENGFDFGIDCSWDPTTGDPVKKLNLSYPRRGRTFAQTGHVFELGRNISAYSWPDDGTIAANTVIVTGSGEGTSMLVATAVDAYQLSTLDSGGPGYPLLEHVMSDKDVSVRSTLQAKAAGRLAARAQPVVLPELTVRADSDPRLGSYIEGDSCRVIVPPNLSPYHPNGLDRFFRVVGWDVTVSDEGDEAVKLILGEEP